MPLRKRRFDFNVCDMETGRTIDVTGGVAFVCTTGGPELASLTDADGVAIANPVPLVRGTTTFYLDDSLTDCDVYVMTPLGHFVIHEAMKGDMHNELKVNTAQRVQVAKIPFSVGHSGFVAATEFDSGLDFPANAIVEEDGWALEITTLDGTETIDVGLLSSETNGDADGFVTLGAVGTAGFFLMNAVAELGALLDGLRGHAITGANAVSLSWTLTAGSDTAAGWIYVPYRLYGSIEA